MSPPVRLAYLAWAAVCLIWGTTYLGIRISLETIPPMLMGGVRWTVAGVLILVTLRMRGEPLPAVRTWPALALLGILLIGLGNGGVVWAERTIPSGLTALLVAVIPFWMVGVEQVAGDRAALSRSQAFGLVVGFAGIAFLVWPELHLDDGPAYLGGVAATQIACLGWAIGSSYSRRRMPAESMMAAAASQMLAGGLAMLVVGLVRQEGHDLAFSIRTATALGYLVLFGSVAGFSAYLYALKHLPVATVSLYAYVNPVIAVLLGTLVLGEPLNPRIASAGAVVLLGMAMVRR
jgi:drug/metabolite transporter (DMT)-like permease